MTHSVAYVCKIKNVVLSTKQERHGTMAEVLRDETANLGKHIPIAIRFPIAKETAAQANAGTYWTLYSDGYLEQHFPIPAVNIPNTDVISTGLYPIPFERTGYRGQVSCISGGSHYSFVAYKLEVVDLINYKVTYYNNREITSNGFRLNLSYYGYAAQSEVRKIPGFENFTY